MKGIKRNIKVYEVGNGFLVEIDYDAKCQGHPTVDAWLWHENYGIKMSMFGCMPEDANDFLETVEANLPEYIRLYAEDYMDGDDWERFANDFCF